MEEDKRIIRRGGILLGFFALCLLFFFYQLYQAQVVHGAEYLSRSTTNVTATQKMEASRGVITDCNGKTLVSNLSQYNLTFDPDQVEGDDTAVGQALLRLLTLLQSCNLSWTDNFPVSQTAPFTYLSVSSTQLSRLQGFLNEMGWSDSQLTVDYPTPFRTDSNRLLTAAYLLSLMRDEYHIDDSFSDEDARMVLGVLYELTLRSEEITYTEYFLCRNIPVELVSILNDGNFAGAVVSAVSVRQYHTEFAAHVLGRTGSFSNQEQYESYNAPYLEAQAAGLDTSEFHYYRMNDTIGKDGVEAAFETYLRGRDGKKLITTDQDGEITSELYAIDPQPGHTVQLTLDIDLQEAVEQYLAMAVEAMNSQDGEESRGAAAAVVSVKDSAVLALASYPTYSLAHYSENFNEYLQDPAKPFINRALNGRYAPGSTFKLCTAVAALETGMISPSTKITDLGRYMYYATDNPATSYTPACWIYRQSGGTHGSINVSEAIYHSCNYFFYDVGRRMGVETLNQYATAFGLGQPTGIELDESVGILDSPQYRADAGSLWVGGTILQCSIGQGDSLFTPIQLANYTATLVRGGDRYAAHILKSVTSSDGTETIFTYEPTVVDSVEISNSTLAAVKKGMGDLVSKGSISKYFSSCVVSAGAKTGSAQTAEKVANGVFVCFAPFEEPEIAVAIVIEQGGSGAALAATAVNILNAYFSPDEIGTAVIPEGTLLP